EVALRCLSGDDPRRERIQTARAAALSNLGRFDDADAIARSLLSKGCSPGARRRCFHLLSKSLLVRGDVAASLTLLEDERDFADERARQEHLIDRAIALFGLGRFQDVESLLAPVRDVIAVDL